MEAQLKSFANLLPLGGFVGMLTDSRSFLSYARHDYFRRILASFLASFIDNGEYPDDVDAVTEIACDISYFNAKRYFGC